MNGEKLKNVITATVVTAVFLLVILVCVLIYQMVCMTQLNKELTALETAEQEYLELKEVTEDEITLWLEDWKIEEAARKYGFRKYGK